MSSAQTFGPSNQKQSSAAIHVILCEVLLLLLQKLLRPVCSRDLNPDGFFFSMLCLILFFLVSVFLYCVPIGKLIYYRHETAVCHADVMCLSFVSVEVQTNLVPPKKVQPGMLQSSLVQASVATMQNPMGCSLPRLSVSCRPPSVVASMEAVADGSAPFTMMKLKTVLAVFVVVVAYLVAGGLVFQALEQPFENNQKITITAEKAAFLQKHPCVSSDELEAIIKVREAAVLTSTLFSNLDKVSSVDLGQLMLKSYAVLTPSNYLTHSTLCQLLNKIEKRSCNSCAAPH